MSKIAIVAALKREVRPLIKDWPSHEKQYAGRSFRFFENEEKNLVLVWAGIGAAAARRATEAVIFLYCPAIVYSVGFAGALNPSLQVGDIVLPRRVINANDGSSTDTGSGEGVLVSFATVASPEQKNKLAESFAASAVDMEAASVARAADARGVRFAAVKSISDKSDFALPAMERFVSATGTFRTRQFAFFMIMRPWLWGTVATLARNSNHASQTLCTYLEQMLRSNYNPLSASLASIETPVQLEASHRQ